MTVQAHAKHLKLFRDLVRKTKVGCWNWMGKRDWQGYAVIAGIKAARLSWEIYHGEIPKGLCVLHTCDNPECTRPEHLWLGTKGQNNADRAQKGRNKFVWRTLTVSDVAAIRRLASTKSQAYLARRFGVSGASIWQIVTRKSYKYVP